MSSVRLFILDALARSGPMHGHHLRLQATQEHIDEWADISVGALYGALNRMETEGLIEEVRTEREGNYPPRRVLAITAAGRENLIALHVAALTSTGLRNDPVDLAIARPQPETLHELEGALSTRLTAYRTELADAEHLLDQVRQHLTVAEEITFSHQLDRLRAEITFHERALAAVPQIIADELRRRETHA